MFCLCLTARDPFEIELPLADLSNGLFEIAAKLDSLHNQKYLDILAYSSIM
jgi:hypothetical protein